MLVICSVGRCPCSGCAVASPPSTLRTIGVFAAALCIAQMVVHALWVAHIEYLIETLNLTEIYLFTSNAILISVHLYVDFLFALWWYAGPTSPPPSPSKDLLEVLVE